MKRETERKKFAIESKRKKDQCCFYPALVSRFYEGKTEEDEKNGQQTN